MKRGQCYAIRIAWFIRITFGMSPFLCAYDEYIILCPGSFRQKGVKRWNL